MSLRVGDPAPQLRVLGDGESQVSLADWWVDAPVVVVFLRHFG